MFCPNCKQEYDGRFCPECGTKLIEKPAALSGGINVNLGDANAISGGVNINVAAQKTEIEVLQERKLLYLNACKRAYEDNVLEQSEKIELDRLRMELGLDEATADEILDQVRQIVMRNAQKTELTGLAKIKLKQLSEALKKNEVQAIIRQIDSLESLAGKFTNDELQYKYYLVLAALRHEKCIEKYESSKVDNYWKSFWSYFAYLKAQEKEKASDILYSLGDKFPNYPEDNIALLAAAGSFIMNSKEAAQDYLTAVCGDYSPALQRFAETIYLLLEPDVAKEMGATEQSCAFYLINIIQATKDMSVAVNKKNNLEDSAQQAVEEQDKYKKLNEINEIGRAYFDGKDGKPKNYEEAVKWFRMAAEQGYHHAQFNMGLCYEYGYGIAQDYTEAVKWYRMAAEQGNADAQLNLGNKYSNGKGVPQNYEEAAKWYRMAAEQGKAIAQYNLGVCYDNGYGVDQDYTEAVNWYHKAAEQGNANAQYNLGSCYYNGEGVTQNYKEAVKWYRMAAEQGNANAQYNLGICYYNGEGVTQDYKEAVKWWCMAAEQGNVDAIANLADCYYLGEGVRQDFDEAVKWFTKAADKEDNGFAKNKLGECFYFGRGVNKDTGKAQEYWTKAADQGDEDAIENLKKFFS